ncbi:hypothetical protein MHU86_11986 [Fragilaria crotonensis]|nr:hypothetical protein MHU86_11986 [Fragilaria crotonensis]
MLAGSRAVRWLSTSKQSTIAPFEAQLTSATQRHREARRKRQEQQHQAPTEADDDAQPIKPAFGGRLPLDGVGGVSQAHSESATVQYRRSKRAADEESRRGSALSLSSTTNQHRHQRQPRTRESSTHKVNPSGSILPTDTAANQEDELRSNNSRINDGAPIQTKPTDQFTRTAVRTLSLFVAVATAAAFGSGLLP